MKPSGPGLLFSSSLLLLLLIQSLVIGLFKFSISSWFGLVRLYIPRDFSVPSRLFNVLECDCSYYSVMIICISVTLVVLSSFSLTIFLIQVLPCFVNLVSTHKCPTILWKLDAHLQLTLPPGEILAPGGLLCSVLCQPQGGAM